MSSLPRTCIVFHRHGGPEVLQQEHDELPAPGPGELRIVQQAVGVNYADIYQRQGAAGPHGKATFPVIPGSQGAGIVESVGAGVKGFRPGQAVTYLYPGAYASARLVPASRALPIPEGLSVETAAALWSVTREMRRTFLQPGRASLTQIL